MVNCLSIRTFYLFHLLLSWADFSLSSEAQAEELSRAQKRDVYESMLLQGRAISPYYREGNELIYDCELKAFVCVDETGKELCVKQASKAKDYPEVYRSCRHFRSYESLQKCTNGQLQMIDRAMESTALGCL